MADVSRFESSMQKAVDALHINFSRIRAGSASPGMLDGMYSHHLQRSGGYTKRSRADRIEELRAQVFRLRLTALQRHLTRSRRSP